MKHGLLGPQRGGNRGPGSFGVLAGQVTAWFGALSWDTFSHTSSQIICPAILLSQPNPLYPVHGVNCAKYSGSPKTSPGNKGCFLQQVQPDNREIPPPHSLCPQPERQVVSHFNNLSKDEFKSLLPVPCRLANPMIARGLSSIAWEHVGIDRL